MLATRPTLLYLAGRTVNANDDKELSSRPLHQFAKACIDAAKRSSAILRALVLQRLLGKLALITSSIRFVSE